MSLAAVAGVVAGFLAAAIAVVSMWRGALRQPWPDRRPYRWFAVAAGLTFAGMIVSQTASLPAGETAMVVSFADLPALLFLPAMIGGLAGMAAATRAEVAGTQSVRQSRRGPGAVFAYLADGYVLAAALFLIGWVTIFGPIFAHADEGAAAFAADLIHPLADLVVFGALLPLVQAAGRRGVTPCLALVAITAGDSLSVGARISGGHPGVAAMLALLAGLGLLALAPWVSSVWSARWAGGAGEVTTAAAAAAAAVAGILVLGQATARGRLPEPVEFYVLGAMAATLAVRVVTLVRRVDSWSRVWQESGRQFRQLAERTSDVVLLCDLDGVIKYASRAVAGYGYTPDTLRGTLLADMLHPEDRASGMRAVRRAAQGKEQRMGRYPCRVRAADGTWRHIQSSVSLYIDPGQADRLLITARDMSAQVALRRQVTHLTFHDGLTGLPNRAFAEQRAQDVLGQLAGAVSGEGEPTVAGVLILDIDGFTPLNDAQGHTAGDLLLAQVARRLRLAVSPRDTVARWGGDEFAVLTESAASADELADVARRLARSLAGQPFRVGDTDLVITASVGVALADGSPAAHVWRNAELALARAKASGTGQVEVFLPGRGESGGEAAGPEPGRDTPGQEAGEAGTPGPAVPAASAPGPGGHGESRHGDGDPGAGDLGAGDLGAGDFTIGVVPGQTVPEPGTPVGEAAETPAGAGA